MGAGRPVSVKSDGIFSSWIQFRCTEYSQSIGEIRNYINEINNTDYSSKHLNEWKHRKRLIPVDVMALINTDMKEMLSVIIRDNPTLTGDELAALIRFDLK